MIWETAKGGRKVPAVRGRIVHKSAMRTLTEVVPL